MNGGWEVCHNYVLASPLCLSTRQGYEQIHTQYSTHNPLSQTHSITVLYLQCRNHLHASRTRNECSSVGTNKYDIIKEQTVQITTQSLGGFLRVSKTLIDSYPSTISFSKTKLLTGTLPKDIATSYSQSTSVENRISRQVVLAFWPSFLRWIYVFRNQRMLVLVSIFRNKDAALIGPWKRLQHQHLAR